MLKALEKAKSRKKGIPASKDLRTHQIRRKVGGQGNEGKNVGRNEQDPKSPFSRENLGSHLLLLKVKLGNRNKTLAFQDQLC